MGWNYEKKTQDGEKMINILRIAFFDVDLVGLRKNGWILAIRRKSKAKRPHLPENKEKGSRKSLCVCPACRGTQPIARIPPNQTVPQFFLNHTMPSYFSNPGQDCFWWKLQKRCDLIDGFSSLKHLGRSFHRPLQIAFLLSLISKLLHSLFLAKWCHHNAGHLLFAEGPVIFHGSSRHIVPLFQVKVLLPLPDFLIIRCNLPHGPPASSHIQTAPQPFPG